MPKEILKKVLEEPLSLPPLAGGKKDKNRKFSMPGWIGQNPDFIAPALIKSAATSMLRLGCSAGKRTGKMMGEPLKGR